MRGSSAVIDTLLAASDFTVFESICGDKMLLSYSTTPYYENWRYADQLNVTKNFVESGLIVIKYVIRRIF